MLDTHFSKTARRLNKDLRGHSDLGAAVFYRLFTRRQRSARLEC